jgi:hypothetical protein
MPKGDIKAGKSAIVGAAGEYFVMAELLRQGWVAGLTPRGAPDFDIVASKDGQTIHVRVKTKTADSQRFLWTCRGDGRVFRAPIRENDFCVLVDIGGAAPKYYVIPTPEVEAQLQEIFDQWRRGKPGRSAKNWVRAFKLPRDDSRLSKFKENWAALPTSVSK